MMCASSGEYSSTTAAKAVAVDGPDHPVRNVGGRVAVVASVVPVYAKLPGGCYHVNTKLRTLVMRALLAGIIAAPIIAACAGKAAPTPTATPWPTSTPIQEYCRQFLRFEYFRGQGTKELLEHTSRLEADPSVAADDSWRLEAVGVSITFQEASKVLRQMSPPPLASEVHELVLELAAAIDSLAASYDSIYEAKDEALVQAILQANATMVDATGIAERLVPMLQELCQG